MDITEHLIRRFYDQVWNQWDQDEAHRILSPDLTFRGSLGDVVHGIDGFLAYQAKIKAAFPDFHNHIEELIVSEHRAAAKLRYTGSHSGEIFGFAPLGKSVAYSGAAFFTVEDGLILSAWVLGDLVSLKQQLGP